MDEMKDLKDVLNRVEGKLIAASKMYSALNFAMWEGVMVFYYILMALFHFAQWETAIYWITGFAVAMYFTIIVGKRLDNLTPHEKGDRRRGKKGILMGTLIGISWGIGAAVGFGIVPAMNLGVNMDASFSMGLLSFIAISIFGMWLTFYAYNIKSLEMTPSFILPAIGVPIVMNMELNSIMFGGLLIALGYTLTIIWCLYNAFHVIEG